MESMESFDMSLFDKLFESETAPEANQIVSAEARTPFPKQTPIGMAYVPFQSWEKPYDDNVGFVRGTIFPSLDKPFIGEEAVKNARKK